MKQPLHKGDEVPFTQVANAILNDKNLSWKAKGVWAYLFSKPNDYDFSSNRIALDATDGRDGTREALKELAANKYLTRRKLSNGKMAYFIHWKDPKTEKPSQATNPKTEKAKDGNSLTGKSRPISNIDKESNIEEENNKVFNENKLRTLMDEYSAKVKYGG